MAQGDHTRSFTTSGVPVRRTTDVDATGSGGAGLGLAANSVLFDQSTLGYKVGEAFSRHVIQCTIGGSDTWVVKGFGPAGSWDTLPNLAADNAVSAVATGKLWIVDARGFEAIGVEFSATGGKASIASILVHA